MEKYQKLKKVLDNSLKRNIELKKYTILKIGGKARYFYEAKKIEDLIRAILICKKENIPYLVIGSGSNILVSDKGFDGLVILNRSNNISFLTDKAQVIADSGVMLGRLVIEAAEHNLGGIENLFAIPGTIGGAIYGNAGANNVEISQFIKSITLLSTNGKIIRVEAKWLKPAYRLTKLKELKKESQKIPIILTVKFQLMSSKKEEILKKIQYSQKQRREKQPYDKLTCGSVFKNPGIGVENSAGYLIDQSNLKGRKIGNAQVSKKHANFMENLGGATAKDVRDLIQEIKNKVKEEKGVELEEEIEYVGKWNHH